MYMNLEQFARPDIQERIKTVILANMFANPFKPYNSLNRLEKINFKREMNKYIKENLNGDDWEDVLVKEYNDLVCAHMDDPVAFNPASFAVETNFESEFILSEEQKAFHGSVKCMADLCAEPNVLKQLQKKTNV